MFTGKTLRRIGTTLLACILALACISAPAGADGGDWICPTCGRKHTAEMNFCGGCRTAKPAAEAAPSDAANAWVCSNCGKICPDADSFCTNCGTDHYETDRKAVLIAKPVPEEYQMSPCSVRRIDYANGTHEKGNMFNVNWYYTHTAPVTGSYSIWLEGQTADFKAYLSLYDSENHSLYSEDFRTNSPYTHYRFKEGERFKIRVDYGESYRGTFTLCIGETRGTVKIQEPCVISDSADYVKQCSDFLFEPKADGQYMLEVTEMKNGQELNLIVGDGLGYTIARSNQVAGIEMGEYLTFDVQAGKKYYIAAWQREKYGAYKLSLFCPNPTVPVSGVNAIGDAVYYRRQKNTYEYTAPVTANYTFSLISADNKTSFDIEIRDRFDNKVSTYANGNCTAALEAGQTCIICVSQYNGTGSYTVLIDNDYTEPEKEPERTDDERGLIGRTVRFGSYEQDNNSGNGPEEIEWTVLDARDGYALLMSRYGLDVKRYHGVMESVTWENSTLRHWLNNDFLSTAFNGSEQSAILTTDVDNSEKQCAGYWSRTTGGRDTQDRVYLLSWHEAEEVYFSDSETRMCAPTEYAAARGAWYVEDYVLQGHYEVDGRPAGYWWLRSPGMFEYEAAYVTESGNTTHYPVNADNICIRPVIRVDLKKASF